MLVVHLRSARTMLLLILDDSCPLNLCEVDRLLTRLQNMPRPTPNGKSGIKSVELPRDRRIPSERRLAAE